MWVIPTQVQDLVDQASKWRRRLLGWYRREHRQLPWRAAPQTRADPYHVLVSEAMLQQTQVATVIPYFHRFITAFPTLAALASAREQQVMRLWQGLGYYRRARHLHAAAQVIMRDHGGCVPDNVATLEQLPGIGRYTAGAIASIAFARPVPLVDGNVARVLARVVMLEEPIDEPATIRHLWLLAQALVPRRHPGDYNQALMELGATCCTPAQPACSRCPVRSLCRAAAQDDPTQWPKRRPRVRPRDATHVMLALQRDDGCFLLLERPDKGLWAGLWQWPTREEPTDKKHSAWISRTLGLKSSVLKRLGQFTHQTTHRTLDIQVFYGKVQGDTSLTTPHVWRRPDALEDLPLSRAQQRALTMLGGK